LQTLISNRTSATPLLVAAHRILGATRMDRFDAQQLMTQIDHDDPEQMFVLTLFHMNDLRMQGRAVEALAQSELLDEQLGKMRCVIDPRGGWRLQAAVQISISALHAGDFTKALTVFTKVQRHPATPKSTYLTRDALVK